MAVKIKQYFNIKFPFTTDNEDGHFIDLNRSTEEKVASQIAHVILTQKGTRLRMPEFGTDLIKYVFEQNDASSWSEVEQEIRKQVSRYVPNASINEVSVSEADNTNSIYVDIKYSVRNGGEIKNYRTAIKL